LRLPAKRNAAVGTSYGDGELHASKAVESFVS
jgi:hypothetical protein